MHIVQIFSAVYILLILSVGIFLALWSVLTDAEVHGTINGFPALLGLIAAGVCAVTVLVEVA